MGQPPVTESDVTGEDPNDEAAKKRKVKLLLQAKTNQQYNDDSSDDSDSDSGSGSSDSGSDDD